jgi:RES domain-containing protein
MPPWPEPSSAVSSPLAGPLRTRAWACRGESLPAGSAADLISDKPNRWSVQGEPTIYLSGDPALALVESGRHPDDLEEGMRLIEVDVRIPLAVDLRRPDVRQALSLPEDLEWVLARERTREVAQSLRHSGMCDAVLVPSAGAPDQPERFNLVVFADDRTRVARIVADLRVVGEVTVLEGLEDRVAAVG